MSNKENNAYPPFEFVAAEARPRALVSKVARRRRRASSWDAIVYPNNIGIKTNDSLNYEYQHNLLSIPSSLLLGFV